MSPEEIQARCQALLDAFDTVVAGKRDVARGLLGCLLAGGHALLEDDPGVGKTTTARTIARLTGISFTRIQFTADLMPADIIGYNIVVMNTGEFKFRPGPLQGGIILADELNRASPRTQSALLEAMEEGQVTVEGETRPLERPFMVLATQNPHGHAGTFRLPDSQVDRFMASFSLGYATRDQEVSLLAARTAGDPLNTLEALWRADELPAMQAVMNTLTVSPELLEWQVDLLRLTREDAETPSASTRAGRSWMRLAMAFAVMSGRDYLTPADLTDTIEMALGHRLAGSSDLIQGRERVRRLRQQVEAPL